MTKKQSWVLPLIECKVCPVLQDYYEQPLNIPIYMHRKQLHELIKQNIFLWWYFAPTDMEQWVGTERDWPKHLWRKRYGILRKIKKEVNQQEQEDNVDGEASTGFMLQVFSKPK